MKITRLIRLPLAACAFAVVGCATNVPADSRRYELPPMRQDTIARLAVDGPNAYINTIKVPHGSYVRDGDIVTTGPGTSVQLLFNNGASIQLDQNTDPLFTMIGEGTCVLMEIIFGQAAVATNGRCVEFRNKKHNTEGVGRSLINVAARENETRVTVIEGHVDMLRPGPAALGADDEYVATSGTTWYVRQLTHGEALSRGAWTQRYFPAPSARQQDATIPIIIGLIGLATLFGGGHGDAAKPSQPAQPPAGAAGAPQTAPSSGRATGVAPAQPAPRVIPGGSDVQPVPRRVPDTMRQSVPGWCCLPGGSNASDQRTCAMTNGTFIPRATNGYACPAVIR